MKNQLDFKVPFVASWGHLNFICCFTSVFMFIEELDISGITNYPCPPRNNGMPCHGCGNVRKGKCDGAALNKVSPYCFLFDTMTGHSSLHDRYDGEPNEMQKLIGDVAGNSSCATDHTVDFLFGFTGYGYRTITDAARFKDEIIASIDAGMPVLAEGNPGEGRGGRFHVITGYDGSELICPADDYFYKQARPDGPPIYNELVALYIFGEKAAPRYTLKDGLENIRRVRGYNVSEKIWDDYLIKMGGWDAFPSEDGLDKADAKEKKARLERMLQTVRYTMNTHCLIKAFQDIHLRHEEMLDPAFLELWKKIETTATYMGHGPEGIIARINWETIRPSTFRGISAKICEAIVKVKEADKQVLEYINHGIKKLDNRED